jgi:hypothetical protein
MIMIVNDRVFYNVGMAMGRNRELVNNGHKVTLATVGDDPDHL